MNDPAITRTKSEVMLGLEKEITQPRTLNLPNPSLGGTRGFQIRERDRTLLTLEDCEDYDLSTETVGCCTVQSSQMLFSSSAASSQNMNSMGAIFGLF